MGGGDWLFDKEEGTMFERLRISLIAPMVDREGDGAGEGGGGDWLFDKEEGTIYEKLRISLIVQMVDRDEGGAAEKRRRIFFFIIG